LKSFFLPRLALTGKTMGVAEAAEAVQKAGYRRRPHLGAVREFTIDSALDGEQGGSVKLCPVRD